MVRSFRATEPFVQTTHPDNPGFAGRPVATIATAAALVAVFIAQSAWDHGGVRTYLAMGGLVPAQALQGDLWQLLSYAVLHAGIQHIAGNMMGLLSLGSFCERVIGSARFTALLILAALGGALACLVAPRPMVVTVGASGAIWGLIGMSTALALRPGGLIPPEARDNFRRNAVTNLVIQLVVSALPGVSAAAHIGGGLVGFVLMITGLLHPNETEYGRDRRPPVAWVIAAAVLTLALAGCVAVAWMKGEPWALGRNDVERVLDGL